jgi:hypothetical protein
MACFWALLFALYAYEASWLPPWPASTPEEDAFISFRFADNLAEGYGPVFNRGGRAVEGYTNFLWVAWLAALHRQWPDTVLHALWSGFALGFLVLPASWLLARRVAGRWAWGVPVVLALSRYHTENALTGLETAAYNLLVLLALLCFAEVLEAPPGQRRRMATAACSFVLVLTALTRFEGVYLFALLSAFWYWHRHRADESALRDWTWYAPFATFYGAYTGWRLLVFGELLPNTYYAKLLITGTGTAKIASGLRHVGDFLLTYPSLPLLAAVFALAVPIRSWRPFHAVLVATLAAQLALVAFVGGDWSYLAPYWRLLSTVAPLFLVLAGAGLDELLAAGRRWTAVALLGVGLVLSAVHVTAWLPAASGNHQRPAGLPSLQSATERLVRLPRELLPRLRVVARYRDTHPERQVGLWLRAWLGPRGRVVGQHAGRIPYYSRLDFVDVIGYTDREPNRRLWDPATGRFDPQRWPAAWEYLLGLEPDALLIVPKADTATYASLNAAIGLHGYCLSHRLVSPSDRTSFLVFARGAASCPATVADGTVDLAGTAYPLSRERIVDLDALDLAP